MTLSPHLGSPEQVARGEEVAVSPEPIGKRRERLPQCLACSFPLDLARAIPGFPTKAGHPQQGQCLGFLSPPVGMRPCLAPDGKRPRFLRRQLQRELLHTRAETCEKVVSIRLRLATRHTVISEPVPRRFTPAVPPHPTLAPAISDVVEGDMGKER
jgi:hypothetical protein